MNDKQEKAIKDAIAYALLDGQNQIYDLKAGKATGEEVNERMQKSYDFHVKQVMDTFISTPS